MLQNICSTYCSSIPRILVPDNLPTFLDHQYITASEVALLERQSFIHKLAAVNEELVFIDTRGQDRQASHNITIGVNLDGWWPSFYLKQTVLLIPCSQLHAPLLSNSLRSVYARAESTAPSVGKILLHQVQWSQHSPG